MRYYIAIFYYILGYAPASLFKRYGMVWYGMAGSVASDYHGGSPGASWTAAPAAGGFAGAQPDNCPA